MADRRESFDVIIIGAGVIGCAIARRFTLQGARVLVLEKAADILDGASKANSAILHTGFDAPPGSLEARCMAEGHAEYRQIHESLGLPLDDCGALVIAWTDDEADALPALIDKARQNGVDDVVSLDSAQTRRLEPELAGTLKASFRVPGESIIDAWSAPHAYLLQALANGAELQRRCEVTGGTFDGHEWRLKTSAGQVAGNWVINAAGLQADHVDTLLLQRQDFTIRPRKGQFLVFDKPAARLARHILLPVPSATTKGIVVCRTAYGNLLVGPTAEEQRDRDQATVTTEVLRSLRQRGEAILPALADQEITAAYAGLRTATEHSEYQIRAEHALQYISVGGIRSTGLSSALGTARHVFRLSEAMLGGLSPPEPTVCPKVANISEFSARRWQTAGHGGIVCHCESVTRREIEDVLSDPLAPQSLAGLKRRTRVTMGRCQGFYCTAHLAEITHGRLAVPMADEADLPP